MYKNCEKVYMSGWICIQIIHISADMYKNCEKVYISRLMYIEITKKYTYRVYKWGLLQSPLLFCFLKRNLLAACVRNRVLADPAFIDRMLRRLETDVTTDTPPI